MAEATYYFGYTDANSFLMTAAALENTGVSAYDGAAQYLTDKGLLTAAGSIVAIEARHASYLNMVTGADPFPEGFEQARPRTRSSRSPARSSSPRSGTSRGAARPGRDTSRCRPFSSAPMAWYWIA